MAESEDLRRLSVERWDEAASGWERRNDLLRRATAPVSLWLVQAIDPQPGQRVLELAAGIGETGFLAAELIVPGGTLITSDQAESMLDGARRRAAALGLGNVEFKVIDAEWIDLPVASVDAILFRWGLMLVTDPAAALAEARRVLRPGGHLALAVWDALEHNPWAQAPGALLLERGLVEPPAPGLPGPFALADADRLRELLEGAGFDALDIGSVEFAYPHADIDSFWDTTLDLSRNFHDAVMDRPADEVEELRDELRRRLEPFTEPDGTLRLPARTLVAVASA